MMKRKIGIFRMQYHVSDLIALEGVVIPGCKHFSIFLFLLCFITFPILSEIVDDTILIAASAKTSEKIVNHINDCKDHPLISRYPGAEILRCHYSEYDEYAMVTGIRPGAGADLPVRNIEGSLTRLRYVAPQGRSTLEVFRNYETALRNAGFSFGFSCSRDECGHAFSITPFDRDTELSVRTDQRYLTATLSRPEGNVHVTLYVVLHERILLELEGRPVIALEIVEEQPMETDLITVDLNAQKMAEAIERDGRVALYGIYFDFRDAAVKEESEPTISEIAQFLVQNPDLRLNVVGHTDHIGSLESNLVLSRQRAQALIDVLVNDYNISRDRLEAHGVAYLSPVANNETEAGRAKNRRVELVPGRIP